MKDKYSVGMLCELLGISRSGYYKWLNRNGQPNCHEKNRQLLTELLQEAHQKHPSYGYHRLAIEVTRETGWIFSHNLAHKCCKQAGIYSKARRTRKYKKHGEESVKFRNLVAGRWNAKEPLQIVTSDMTMFKCNNKWYEWTLLIDTFNNEILAHSVSSRPGDSKPYYHCLNALYALSQKRKKQSSPITYHTDQGAVYSSRAYNQAHEKYNIIRSMSREGTPTDNPVIESLNGWIKEELFVDFGLATSTDVIETLNTYVEYFNNRRPAAALQYKSPVQYKIEQGFG